MFPLFETIKIVDGIPQHLEYHQKRIELSLKFCFKAEAAFDELSELIQPSHLFKGILKCKFSYNSEDFDIEYSQYTPKKIQSLKLVNDDSISYANKFTDRSCFDTLLENVAEDDIIIVKNGLVTDTSFSNLCFFDGYRWLTPSTLLLKGTARRRLLNQGLIFEKTIKAKQIFTYQKVMLINAMLDFDENNSLDISCIVK